MKYSSLNKLVEDSIAKEKDMKPNPFMNDRIMSAITDSKQRNNTTGRKVEFRPIWQNIAIAASISIAIIMGILAGNSLSTNPIANNTPEELIYLNDGAMESITNLGL